MKNAMNSEKLLNAIGKIDDNLILDAVNDTPVTSKRKHIWLKFCAAAACLALIVYAGTQLVQNNNSADTTDRLPMLTITEGASSSMGYEGYMLYEISELVNANPWNENAEISTLPVYENPLSYDENYVVVSGADFNAMEAFLLEIAARLDIDTDNLKITNNNRTQVTGKTEGITIVVDTSMTATISFEPAVSLPEGYNFSHHSSYDDTLAVAEYLEKEYEELLGTDNPQINIYGGDYNIYLQQSYRIEFFNASDDLTERIINYNFNRTAFYCDDDDELFLARTFKPDLSHKAGDYPIISAAEAKELLLNMNYITTVPYEMPGEEYIAKVELVYRVGEYEKYYIPYYRFYVELPDAEYKENNNGTKTYGAYYVPAVEGRYISNMPLWDGHFN